MSVALEWENPERLLESRKHRLDLPTMQKYALWILLVDFDT